MTTEEQAKVEKMILRGPCRAGIPPGSLRAGSRPQKIVAFLSHHGPNAPHLRIRQLVVTGANHGRDGR